MPSPATQVFPQRSTRIVARVVALATCVGMLTGATPTMVWAAPGEDEAPADPEAIFRRGQAKYETADYNGAIELWTEAYALVEPIPENASIKALLIYNLAQAHIKAYELDDDAIHLKQAQQLLRSFEANLELLYDDPKQLEEERTKVSELLTEIDAKIAAHDPEVEPEPDEPPPPEVEPKDDDVQEPGNRHPGTPLVIAGGVVTGLGALAGVGAIVGGLIASNSNDISDLEPDDLQGREDRFAAGVAGNGLALAGGIGAGVLLPTGIALMVVGILRNKRAQSSSTAFAPTLGRGSVGLGITGRF
jgi:hypothetical protein